jgi:hypothetical protein
VTHAIADDHGLVCAFRMAPVSAVGDEVLVADSPGPLWLVQEEIAGRLTEATNRNLFLLSIVTTTLLPITLITGIFGMNVGGLPWVKDPGGFWWVMGVIGVGVVVTLALLRRRRVL